MTTKGQRPCRCKAVTFKEDDDSDTEVEEFNLEPRKSDGRELQIIHSGHFMVSSLHMEHTPKKGYDFDTVNKQTCRTYHFGKTSRSHLSIDASLTKLFECMTLAYSGKLVSPKWKNFKGLKLLWRDKIRLNNAIWRAWYMQYVERRKNPICHFVTPLDGSIETEDQRRPEAISTETKCWKRGVDIAREYHKWRTYFKKRLQKHKDEDLSSLLKGTDEPFSLFGEVSADILQHHETGVWRAGGGGRQQPDSPVPMEMDPLFDMEMWMSESSDTLFSTLASHQPAGWPNPRDIGHNGNADMIQPGLGNLQPNLDFTVDPFEFLQDLFHSLRQPGPTPSSSVLPTPSSSSQAQPSLLPSVTTSPKIPSVSATNRVGDMCTEPFCSESYTPLFPGPPAPVPESATAVPLAPPPSISAPHPSVVQCSNMATWNPTLGNPLPPSTATVRSRSPRVTPKPAPPSALTPPRAQPQPLPVEPVARPAFKLPKPREPPDPGQRTRRVQNIVPAKPRPPPPLFVAGPFPAHHSAVLITPGPLQAEAPPPSNVICTAGDITQCCRQSHISAEQKRRFSINLGFRTLCSLVPTLKTKSSSRPVTNAATLQKTVEYIGKLQQERHQMQEEVRCLREEIEELNASISSCHQKLPATGVPVKRHRHDYMWDRFNEYVRSRTLHNWKFWIFSIIIKPLFESFNSMVSTASVLELRQTTLRWLEQHCSLPALRPMVRDTLLQLSTSTSILTDPTRLPEEACQAAGRTPVGKTGES
ncbi:hypothetical protein ANANG_G00268050 [Anguilla anguilla]|uniref:BHLH domain-containing protein n=1 Tax=Anguilla anguilla TaxID=7936 RepID=A0A9D3LRC2_ANGAN|nr:hypothetical protein ANANG_G00268050 [Anguilla anguilla]